LHTHFTAAAPLAEERSPRWHPPIVRVSQKPDFRGWRAILYRLWENRLILLAPGELAPGAVLAIQMPGDFDDPGVVVVGQVERATLHERTGWLVSCVLLRRLSGEAVLNTPTLFSVLSEVAERD
jgi:hypothetical protein